MAFLDYLLPDGDGIYLAVELLKKEPQMQLTLMTGLELPSEEKIICQRYDIPILKKPFLGEDVLSLVQRQPVRKGRLHVGSSGK